MAYLNRFLIFLTLYAASAYAYLDWSRGCTKTQSDQIESAIDEAIKIANELYESIGKIRITHPATVTFYCSESHMQFDFARRLWRDNDNFYFNEKNEKVIVHYYMKGISDPNTSPGTKGSYSTLGYAPQPGVDFSSQGHIYIHPSRFNSNPRYDTRPFTTIRSAGLNPQYNYLDGMKPLAETVFHELLHIVGGTVAPDSATTRIGDGPSQKTYGYEKCVKMNFDVTLGQSDEVADCILIAAKALYLQIENPDKNPAWWSTGIVDPEHLAPIDLPPASGAKARQVALSFEV